MPPLGWPSCYDYQTVRKTLGGFFSTVLLAAAALGCDLCGCYTPQLETTVTSRDQMASTSGAYAAVAEQFTSFNTLQLDGREVANPAAQYLQSSITQLVLGYGITPRFAVQVNVPLIYRSFRRPEGFAIDRGSESGVGDVVALGKCVLFHHETGGARGVSFDDPKNPRMEVQEPTFATSVVALGGVKFPTGATSRLKEEFNEAETAGAPASGIHGHDLALGSGSCDGLFGGEASLRYRSFFLQADAQYTLRSEGAHQYRFANNISWSGGPGYYILRKPNAILGVQCACSGEHKGLDRFRGEHAEDTGITSVFVGPRIVGSFDVFTGELGAEFPVSIDNTALQIVPDYRLRASVGVRF